MTSHNPTPQNRLLASLPQDEWKAMRLSFAETELSLGQSLFEARQPFKRLYFPTAGVLSTVAVFEDGSTAEMATTGREGMVPVGAILGSDRAMSRYVVQVPGAALVVGHADFKRFAEENPTFRGVLFAYAQAFLAQVHQSVACNTRHSVEERAARWLLMCDDRTKGDLPLTQEFLSAMLGVSRPTVSIVARTLQRAGLIRYTRGTIKIEDRAGLEEASCECYRAIRREYEDRLGPILNRTEQAD